MPRTSRDVKQTRLAFAPTGADGTLDPRSSPFPRLAYGNPSVGTVRTSKSHKSQSAPQDHDAAERSTSHMKASDEPVKPSKKTKSKDKNKEAQAMKSQSDDTKPEVQNTPGNKSSSEDDVVIVTSQRKKRYPPIAVEVSLADFKDPKDTKDTSMETSDSDEEAPRSHRKLKRKAKSSPIVLSDSEDSEELVSTSPVKRRRRAVDEDVPQTPRATTDQARLDIEEDLEDLQESVVKKNRTRGRLAESARAKKQKQLEILRRKRAGLKEESDAGESGPVESDTGTEPVSASRRPAWDSGAESSITSNEDLDRYEDDFVLEDENDKIGVPTEEIPFEFTRHAYKQPKEYFRDVVEWMVHNKLNPAFPRSNALYEMAFMKLEDEVKGRAGSQLISSVWNVDFLRALLARPHIEMTAFPTAEGHPCDACNRSGHPASTDMKLFGKAYSLETLESLTDESSSDEEQSSRDDDEPDVERDRDGHVLPNKNKRFYLGRQCKAKAALAHTLTHWRFHLNEWVVDYLEDIGHMDDNEVLKRNDMSQKRKTKNANSVVDTMIETGQIDKLWRDFHLCLKEAREKTSILG